MHSFAPLQTQTNIKDLLQCDQQLLNLVSKRKGLTNTDARHSIFISEANMGYGIRSFLDVHIVACVRELEVTLNGVDTDCKVARARLAAYRAHSDQTTGTSRNHINYNIQLLGKYGIFLRDSNDGIINYLISWTFMQGDKRGAYGSIGSPNYRCPKNECTTGEGHGKYLDYTICGDLHFQL